MYEVLDKVPSFGERLGLSLGGGLSQGIGSGIDYAQKLGLQRAKKKEDDTERFDVAVDTLRRMQEILDTGNVGTTFGKTLDFTKEFGEAGIARAEFEQLGKSLIPIVAAGVPIRNQREFDEYKRIITNPRAKTEDLQGAIRGLENILTRKSSGHTEKETSGKTEGFVLIESPSGKRVKVPHNQVEMALNKGGKRVG